jgi:hypothetical protein
LGELAYRLQPNLGFEFRRVRPALLAFTHSLSSFQARQLEPSSRIRGPLYPSPDEKTQNAASRQELKTTGEQIGYRRIYCSSQCEFADCSLV